MGRLTASIHAATRYNSSDSVIADVTETTTPKRFAKTVTSLTPLAPVYSSRKNPTTPCPDSTNHSSLTWKTRISAGKPESTDIGTSFPPVQSFGTNTISKRNTLPD